MVWNRRHHPHGPLPKFDHVVNDRRGDCCLSRSIASMNYVYISRAEHGVEPNVALQQSVRYKLLFGNLNDLRPKAVLT